MKRDKWDHIGNGLWVNFIMNIGATRGIPWGKAQIRMWEWSRVHRKKHLLKNDRYDCDKGE
jgi:hypothetical protein